MEQTATSTQQAFLQAMAQMNETSSFEKEESDGAEAVDQDDSSLLATIPSGARHSFSKDYKPKDVMKVWPTWLSHHIKFCNELMQKESVSLFSSFNGVANKQRTKLPPNNPYVVWFDQTVKRHEAVCNLFDSLSHSGVVIYGQETDRLIRRIYSKYSKCFISLFRRTL